MLFLQFADGSGTIPISASLDGSPLKLEPAYSSIRTHPASFVGFYADISAVEPDKEESALRDQFWRKVRRVAASIPFAEDLLTAYYCAFDRATPLSVKATLVGALAYFVMPIDAIPDVVPLLGFTDDAAMLAAPST